MKQAPIDLLPESIRQRSQAHVRTGRIVVVAIITSLVVIVFAGHARMLASHESAELRLAEARAADVIALEERAGALRARIAETRTFLDRYDEVAMPLPVSGVLATVINELPESVTLVQVTLDAGRRRTSRSARSRGGEPDTGPPPRMLTAELSGFAATDGEIAELVERLSNLDLMEAVSLDFSRTRAVRGRSAREFRLSFRIDLEARYDAVARHASAAEETTHVGP